MPATNPTSGASSAVDPASAPLVNPSLSANLRAEYEELLLDLQHARTLVAELQKQLDGKSQEVGELKQLFEKAQADLSQLQQSILKLREERHRLANEAMRAMAYERRLEDVTAERDRLAAELALIREGAAASEEENARNLRERDDRLALLSAKVQQMQPHGSGGRSRFAPPVDSPADPAVASTLVQLWDSVERTQHALDFNAPR